MKQLVAIFGSLLLLAATAFCLFGFVATFEPTDNVTQFMAFRIGYSVIGLLVLIGATADGTKELIAVVDGVRESELSWKEVLLSLPSRGLVFAPELAIGDGAPGFWKALDQVLPGTRVQHCTVQGEADFLHGLERHSPFTRTAPESSIHCGPA